MYAPEPTARPDAPEAIPEGAVERLMDGFWADDAMPEQIGGSTYKSNGAFGGGGLRWVWDGVLAGGQRTLFVDVTNDDLGALAADDATPATVYSGTNLSDPVVYAQTGGMIHLGLATGGGIVSYAGSRKTASYSTGTVTVTEGSTTVTGAGTAWLANVDSGMIFGASTSELPVASVASDTSLTLAVPWPGSTQAGIAYAIQQTVTNLGSIGTFNALAAVGDRLVGAVGNIVYVSPIDDPLGTWNVAEDFLEFPGTVTGLAAIRDTLMVFTTAGTYAIYNLAVDQSDASGATQWRMEVVSREMILWGAAGIASWRGSLIVPARDGVWLLDTASSPTRISDAITPAYRHALADRPGQAVVFQGHYILPVVDSGSAEDAWMCRLTPNRYGESMLWSHVSPAHEIVACAVRISGSEDAVLLGADEDGRVRTLHWFAPLSATTGANGAAPTLYMVSRGIPTGNGLDNYVASVELRYTLEDPSTVDPEIEASWILNSAAVAETGASNAPEADASAAGVAEYTWPVRRSARTIQFRFLRTGGAPLSAKLRGFSVRVRQSGGS